MSDIFSWKYQVTLRHPWVNAYERILPPGENYCTYFLRVWIKTNCPVPHVKIYGCCKSEPLQFLEYVTDSGNRPRCSNNLTSLKSVKKWTWTFFFAIIKAGEPHSDLGCGFSTSNSTKRSTFFLKKLLLVRVEQEGLSVVRFGPKIQIDSYWIRLEVSQSTIK